LATNISRQQAAELLPWFANGTLAADQLIQVEGWLQRDAGLRAELEFLRQAGAVLRDTADRPSASSIGRFLDRVAADQADGRTGGGVVGIKRARPSLSSSGKWAFALAAGVILAQAIVIGALVMRDADQGVLEPLSGTPQGARANLQAIFVETIAEIEIRALLAEVNAQIVTGPGTLGVYGLHVPPAQLDAAERRLREASGVVASVTRVDGR
jgi:hypothetical protein